VSSYDSTYQFERLAELAKTVAAGRSAKQPARGDGSVSGAATPSSLGAPAAGATALFNASRRGSKLEAVTTYGDLNGTGADPWKLMAQLGVHDGPAAARGGRK
jgi:hypothetical protein